MGSEEVKFGHFQKADITETLNAPPQTSNFQKKDLKFDAKKSERKNVPKLKSSTILNLSKQKLEVLPSLSRLTAREHVIKSREPIH